MTTEEELIARHKKELRDLVATTTGMKKQATKSTRKDVMKKIQQMETDLKQRHEQELLELNGVGQPEGGDEDEDELTPEKLLAQLELSKGSEETPKEPEQPKEPKDAVPASQGQGKKKRNRQKEKLAKREAEIKKLQEEAQQEASKQPNFKEMELNNIAQLCSVAKLQQHDIQPDGHCLFASIADQLSQRHGITTSIQELRTKAANHIRADPDTYSPYLFDEGTMQMQEIGNYTKEIETTAKWGSDLEIMALAKEFDCPISVMMSGRATHKINEEGKQPELKLVYYQHAFGLGEHYNSLRDL